MYIPNFAIQFLCLDNLFFFFLILFVFDNYRPRSYKKPQKETLCKTRKSEAKGKSLYLG